MNDVQPGSGFTGKQRCTLDRLELRKDRARFQKVSNILAALLDHSPRQSRDQFMVLCMNGHRQSESRSFAQTLPQGKVIHTRKLIETRVAKKGLEADDPALSEAEYALGYRFDIVLRGRAATPMEA